MKRATQTKIENSTETDELDLELTKVLYQRAKRAINRSAEKLENSMESADEKALQLIEKNLTTHNKMLENLMKMTGGLNAGQPRSNTVDIDLDAARSEIVERLSRIRAAS